MTIKEILTKWYREAFKGKFHLLGPIYYHIDNNTLLIFTNWPGILIGLHGQTIDKYIKILKENNFNYEIKFVELSKYVGVYEI